jgi:Right handed beta helix region
MSWIKLASFGLAAAFIAILPTAPAQATGAARTFLSAAGSDSNNCINVLTPCRHLATAFAATAPDGEIYVLDPANYGSLTITHGVSIEGHGWASIAPPIDSPAIIISAGLSDKINIIGVVLDGTAIAGSTGIQFNDGGSLTVRDSVIRNFVGYGIFFGPGASSQLYVSNTVLSDNGVDGIQIAPSGPALGTTSGILNHVEMEHNAQNGLSVFTNTQSILLTVSDSVSANNANNGILANSTGGQPSNVMVRNSVIANNGNDGLLAQNAGATIRITRSTITGNAVGWVVSSPGVVLSYGDNNIDGNTSVNTEPPNPLTYH